MKKAQMLSIQFSNGDHDNCAFTFSANEDNILVSSAYVRLSATPQMIFMVVWRSG